MSEPTLTLQRLAESIFLAYSGGKKVIDDPDGQYAFVLHEGTIYRIDKQHGALASKKGAGE